METYFPLKNKYASDKIQEKSFRVLQTLRTLKKWTKMDQNDIKNESKKPTIKIVL